MQVHAGVYKGVVTVTHSGNPTAGFITIEAAPGGLPEERNYAPELTAEAVNTALAEWAQRHP